jgi:hypothetical protein
MTFLLRNCRILSVCKSTVVLFPIHFGSVAARIWILLKVSDLTGSGFTKLLPGAHFGLFQMFCSQYSYNIHPWRYSGQAAPCIFMVIPADELDKSCTACFSYLASMFWSNGEVSGEIQQPGAVTTLPCLARFNTYQNGVHLDPKSVE